MLMVVHKRGSETGGFSASTVADTAESMLQLLSTLLLSFVTHVVYSVHSLLSIRCIKTSLGGNCVMMPTYISAPRGEFCSRTRQDLGLF